MGREQEAEFSMGNPPETGVTARLPGTGATLIVESSRDDI